MTIKTNIKNEATEAGRFIEVTVFSRLATGVDRENAKDKGIHGKIIEVDGVLAVVGTNFRLAPEQSMDIWVHDFQGYIVREVT